MTPDSGNVASKIFKPNFSMTKFRTSINIYSVNLCEQTITIKVAYITSEPVCLKEEIGENRRVKVFFLPIL